MRYGADHKAGTRRKLLSEAAAAIRERGPARISVAELMAKVGLTHGGFYAHFKSKDELVAHAISQMFDERYELFRSCVADAPPQRGLAQFVDRYLCGAHRDNVGRGCPMPCLAGDLARLPLAARKRFEAGVERLAHGIAAGLQQMGKAQPRELADSLLAEMVGALALSRAVAERQLAEQILESSRAAIKRRIGLGS